MCARGGSDVHLCLSALTHAWKALWNKLSLCGCLAILNISNIRQCLLFRLLKLFSVKIDDSNRKMYQSKFPGIKTTVGVITGLVSPHFSFTVRPELWSDITHHESFLTILSKVCSQWKMWEMSAAFFILGIINISLVEDVVKLAVTMHCKIVVKIVV